jgi:putative ABC transport system substrate-binding protein
MASYIGRRKFLATLGGAAAAWPLAAEAQQPPPVPTVGFVHAGAADAMTRNVGAFRKGLSEAGYVEGQNVTVAYHWLEGRYDRLPALIADLVSRRVAVIATPGNPPAAVAAKAATTTIPIVFGVGIDPVAAGLVASLNRPGGNATGINFLIQEATSKRLALLHELVPSAARIAVLVNPANAPVTDSTLSEAQQTAGALGLQVLVVKASTIGGIDEAFTTIVGARADALLVAGDGFYASRRSQFATLAARDRIPTSCANREMVEAGLLMSYGTNIPDMFRQVGIYVGAILKGVKPADLPVLQSTKFEFVINLQTARALGLKVPNSIQLLADELIE